MAPPLLSAHRSLWIGNSPLNNSLNYCQTLHTATNCGYNQNGSVSGFDYVGYISKFGWTRSSNQHYLSQKLESLRFSINPLSFVECNYDVHTNKQRSINWESWIQLIPHTLVLWRLFFNIILPSKCRSLKRRSVYFDVAAANVQSVPVMYDV
jgi:hypothetical protein